MFEPTTLRQSTLTQEGPLLVSKAIKIPMLVDPSEMEDLFSVFEKEVGSFNIYYVQGVCKREEGKVAKCYFLNRYTEYVAALQKGEIPANETYRPLFSSFLSITDDILYSLPIENDLHLIKATRPVLQMQLNPIHYSKEGNEFRSMVFGSDSISWGIQFSYPQLFQDSKTQEIHPIRETSLFPNTTLFKVFQRWVRGATLPTPFIIDGKKIQVPIRLGKKCFQWIGKHPQLIQKGIQIHGATS